VGAVKIARDGTVVTLELNEDEFASLLFLSGYATGTAMRNHDIEAAENLHPFAKALYDAVNVAWRKP
jgi:hypothetical protein